MRSFEMSRPKFNLPVSILVFMLARQWVFVAYAQNLCPNAGFETVSPCPGALSQLTNAAPWADAVGSFSTSDVFNACHLNNLPVTCQDVGVPANFCGNAFAHTGDGYAGFIAYYGSTLREYLQEPLDSVLDPGTAYRVEVYVRRASLSRFAIDKIGILLTAGPANQNGSNTINLVPQVETSTVVSDTALWTLITGIYIASGGENYITIGNFRDNNGINILDLGLQGSSCTLPNASAYYYVDDARVERINERVLIAGDTLICMGDSVNLTANTNVAAWWSSGLQPNDTLSLSGSISVFPNVTTTYILNGILIKDSLTVYVVPPPLVDLGKDTAICEGLSIILNAANPNCTYFWSTGDTISEIGANLNKTYWVIADNGGCADVDSLNLTILSNPPVQLGPDTVFCLQEGPELFLDAGVGSAYYWSPNGDTSRIIQVQNELTYSVVVQHDNGCPGFDSISTVEICQVRVFVPNAFTPNNDGRNDVFLPVVQNELFYELKIFNRWGTLLYATSKVTEGWDGSFNGNGVPSGRYSYMIRYGSVTDSQRIDKKTIRGMVELIR